MSANKHIQNETHQNGLEPTLLLTHLSVHRLQCINLKKQKKPNKPRERGPRGVGGEGRRKFERKVGMGEGGQRDRLDDVCKCVGIYDDVCKCAGIYLHTNTLLVVGARQQGQWPGGVCVCVCARARTRVHAHTYARLHACYICYICMYACMHAHIHTRLLARGRGDNGHVCHAISRSCFV